MKSKKLVAIPQTLVLTKPKITPLDGARAYAQLRRDVEQAGILRRSYGFYTILTSCVTLGFVASLVAFAILGNPLLLVLSAAAAGFFTVQFGGLMHDAGHRAVASSTRINDLVGNFYSAFAVMAFDEWKSIHNRHHANPNEEVDPDAGIIFHSFTQEQLEKQKGLARFLTQFQVYLFYPIRSFAFLTNRIGSLAYYLRDMRAEKLATGFVFVMGILLWFVGPFIVFAPLKALLFTIIANFTAGFYMSNVFAPNHKGMPMIAADAKLSFLEQQIVTARNIAPSRFTDFLYLGLNYQIEHHLFPACPRNKLNLLTPFVKKVCRKYGLPYAIGTVKEVHSDILGKLSFVAKLATKYKHNSTNRTNGIKNQNGTNSARAENVPRRS